MITFQWVTPRSWLALSSALLVVTLVARLFQFPCSLQLPSSVGVVAGIVVGHRCDCARPLTPVEVEKVSSCPVSNWIQQAKHLKKETIVFVVREDEYDNKEKSRVMCIDLCASMSVWVQGRINSPQLWCRCQSSSFRGKSWSRWDCGGIHACKCRLCAEWMWAQDCPRQWPCILAPGKEKGKFRKFKTKMKVTYGQKPVEAGKDDVLQGDQKGKAQNQRQCKGDGQEKG